MVALYDGLEISGSKKRASFQQIDDPTAKLVGIGFRSWYAGYETGDINCWEAGWHYFNQQLGHTQAKGAVTELACWVRAVREHTKRSIEVFPMGCDGFNADERLAISLVAATQDDACPALTSCAYALIGTDNTQEVINAAQGFAHVLSGAGLHFDTPHSATL